MQNVSRGRGGAGPGGYQQRYDHRRDDWHNRRDDRVEDRGQQHQVNTSDVPVRSVLMSRGWSSAAQNIWTGRN